MTNREQTADRAALSGDLAWERERVLRRLAELSSGAGWDLGAHARQAVALAERRGVRLYLVGGVVRDLMLGRGSEDLDLLVESGDERVGLDFAAALATELGGSVRLYPGFRTAEVQAADGGRIDVAVTRRERYPRPAALPVVEAGDLESDLARRDFTVNAMALPLYEQSCRWVDPFGGARDLAAGWLRVLHEDSFLEDPTRLLRGARLGARLGLRFAPETEELARRAAALGVLDQLSGSRLWHELVLLLADGDIAAPALTELSRLGVTAAFHPALEWLAGDDERLRAVSRCLPELPPGAAPEAQRAALLRACGWLSNRSPALRVHLADRLRLDGHPRELLTGAPERIAAAAAELARAAAAGGELPPHRASSILRRLGDDELLLMGALAEPWAAEWARRERHEMRPLALSIGGAELLALGFAPGASLGAALAAIRDARLDGRIERSQELAMARRLLAEEAPVTGAVMGAATRAGAVR
jgi:tRNA nucleotidyltransferase (CCA-adding enzyme)